MIHSTTVLTRIASFTYDYDSVGRRTKATLQDGSQWIYGYNDRSEVTSAVRKDTSGHLIAPLGASYGYDGIGNRSFSNSPVLGDHTYATNSRNQYTSIGTGNARTVVGRAPAGWSLEVRPSGSLMEGFGSGIRRFQQVFVPLHSISG